MEDVKKDIRAIRESQVRMEEDIKHHIQRTDDLQDLYEKNTERIEKLEKGPEARKYFLSIVISCGRILGFAFAVVALIKYFK